MYNSDNKTICINIFTPNNFKFTFCLLKVNFQGIWSPFYSIKALFRFILVLCSFILVLCSFIKALCSFLKVLCSFIKALCYSIKALYYSIKALFSFIKALYYFLKALCSSIKVMCYRFNRNGIKANQMKYLFSVVWDYSSKTGLVDYCNCLIDVVLQLMISVI